MATSNQESTTIGVIKGLNGLLMTAAIVVFIGYFGIYLLYARAFSASPMTMTRGGVRGQRCRVVFPRPMALPR